jgi:HAD superfamily hydrolase (TIGR01490 family)
VAVAFFDFDKTLIRRNSGTLWLRQEIRAGNLRLRTAAQAAGWLLQYRMGRANLEAGILAAIETLRGHDETVLRQRIRTFYHQVVRATYRPQALQRLRSHQARGDDVVLLSSASEYLAEAVQEDLQLDAILCTRFEVDGTGRLTGRPLLPLCYGDGKRILAQAWLRTHGRDAQGASFYTDSMSDAPFLEVVDRPVVVNPDPRLARLARRRGWPIENWNGRR